MREHAAWALGRIGGEEARTVLSTAKETELDDDARQEIGRGIEEIDRSRTPVDG